MLNTLVPKLLELGMVIKTRKISLATLYKINQENVAVKQLMKLYNNLLLGNLTQIEESAKKKVKIAF